ncbi:MAG: hypothetical protein QNK35_00575 [Bacteroides sp.]|nr:hypothetical protein [Bacteroides sp.]
MKYIVVYIILILGLSSLNTAAQKPTLDLLPYASESLHPEAMIDTCIAHDSLFLIDSIAPLPESGQSKVMEERKKAIKTGVQAKPSFYPLFIKSLNPISFFIHFTALKF